MSLPSSFAAKHPPASAGLRKRIPPARRDRATDAMTAPADAAPHRHEEARNGLAHDGLREKVEALARPGTYPHAPAAV